MKKMVVLMLAMVMIAIVATVFSEEEEWKSNLTEEEKNQIQENEKHAIEDARKNLERMRLEEEARDAKFKSYPVHIQNLIKEKKIALGMTKEQVEFAWGTPNRVHKSLSTSGKREMWVYGQRGSYYLHFENGVLTTIDSHQ